MFLGQGITHYKNRGDGVVGGAFSIANSFLLDGINEYFTIPQADLIGTLSGSNKTITYGFTVQRFGGLGTQQMIFNVNNLSSFYIMFNSANIITLIQQDSGAKTLNSTTVTTTGVWYNVLITYDPTQALGSRGKIYINNVDTTNTDTLTTTIDAPTDDYRIGIRGTVNDLIAYVNQVFVLDVIPTSNQRTSFYNAGKPKNPQTFFGANCKAFYNPDTSGATAQFVMTDSVNSTSATSVNLEDADKTTVTPY
jgi:hypothetical protein